MNVIITGSTGMIGKGILIECLEHKSISKVLVINRRPIYVKHEKLTEVILTDFAKINTIGNKLVGYDACFYSLGVSSVGLKELQYTLYTYEYAKKLVDILYKLNPNTIFNFVSGKGTDSNENSNMMWANVKGRTENYILNKGFKDSYAFRPGAIIPKKGTKSRTKWVNIAITLFRPIFPIMNMFNSVTTTTKIGLAMISTSQNPVDKKILYSQDINTISKKFRESS